MSDFIFDREKHIIIDAKVYDRADFGDEQIQAVSMVNYADQEIQSMTANLDIYKAGRDVAVRSLIDSLKDFKVLAEFDGEKPPESGDKI